LNTHFDPELSRLAFEDRLIEFCEDADIPLLERVRLLGIVAGRLDVFFMTRVGRLKRLVASGDDKRKNGGASPAEQLDAVATESKRIMRRAYGLLENEFLPTLEQHGVGVERWDTLADRDRDFLRRACARQLETSIRPRVVKPGDAFPHVRNLRPAVIAVARRLREEAPPIVVVELPADLPRLVPLKAKQRFVPLEQIIVAELPALCRDLDVGEAHLFRVTRNADTDFEAEYDVLGHVEEEVVRRPFQEVVRLEVDKAMPESLRDQLVKEFQREEETPAPSLDEQDVYAVPGLLDLTALEQIADLNLPQLKCAPLTRRATRIDSGILDAATSDNVLLHFPFDDYGTSLERFLAEAAKHPQLESIQTTIYRTDKKSAVVAALIAAKARGADATAVVELKASFDERENIEVARNLEAAGVHVVLSPTTTKVHAKIALVTVRDGQSRRRVALIGTGNMNAVTSRSYIDLWLVTQDPKCTREVARLFDVLTAGAKAKGFDCLLVAPFNMRHRFLELIDAEAAHARAGKPSGIRAMINGLTDPAIIAALNRASQAGVPIDLMVRGVCLMRPGAPEISENVRIVSVAGQLLQHARIFHFTNGGDDRYFIGSADWRPRNLDGRIEVVTTVSQADHLATLDRVLTETLGAKDAWVLGADGVYRRTGKAPCGPADQGSRTYVTLTPS
jgi:polyphosphate kinase